MLIVTGFSRRVSMVAQGGSARVNRFLEQGAHFVDEQAGLGGCHPVRGQKGVEAANKQEFIDVDIAQACD